MATTDGGHGLALPGIDPESAWWALSRRHWHSTSKCPCHHPQALLHASLEIGAGRQSQAAATIWALQRRLWVGQWAAEWLYVDVDMMHHEEHSEEAKEGDTQRMHPAARKGS